MKIYSLVAKRIEDGGWTGVCRFDQMLRRVFSELQSITPALLPGAFAPDDVVIADNHLSLLVPDSVKTIVVHHGCAEVHYERDPHWRTDSTRAIVEQQRAMFEKPNRKYVAPSQWAADQFWPKLKFICIQVIPHWVDPLPRAQSMNERPVIIGDWRDWNKGSGIWRELADRCPQWKFRPLSFRNDTEKKEQYKAASLFLSLSLCEGAGYAMADAEAAKLPIVTTDTGLFQELSECAIIPWQKRNDLQLIECAIENRLRTPRVLSFYERYSFGDWAGLWRKAIQ